MGGQEGTVSCQIIILFEQMSEEQPIKDQVKENEASAKENSQQHHHLHKENSVKEGSFTTDKFRRNTLIFGIFMIILQAGICVTYGILFRAPAVQMNIGSAAHMVLFALMIVAGFGLLFGYTVRLTWTSVGFNLLITALCLELYPLINAFWTRAALQGNNNPQLRFNNGNKLQDLFLTDRETSVNQQLTFYGNSLYNALKCALSIVVAYSSVLGRTGQLECLIITIAGVIGFELNRQLIQEREGSDSFGTMIIFAFGGFMGLGLALFSKLNEAGGGIGPDSKLRYRGQKRSVERSMLGALIIFATMPALAFSIDAYTEYSAFNVFSNLILVALAMGAAGLTAAGISSVINGYLIVRDFIHGGVAGAIAVGAASLYITNPVYGVLSGAIAGLFQGAIQALFQTPKARDGSLLSTVSWSLFGFQGLLGAALSAAWKAVAFKEEHSLTVQPGVLHNFQSYRQFLAGLIAAGIGLAFGLLTGLIVYLINSHEHDQYFEDFYYWMGSDGIRLFKAKEGEQQPVSRPVIAIPDDPEPEPLNDESYYDEEEDEVQVEMSVPSEDDYEMGLAYL